jgi:hypothetical protein
VARIEYAAKPGSNIGRMGDFFYKGKPSVAYGRVSKFAYSSPGERAGNTALRCLNSTSAGFFDPVSSTSPDTSVVILTASETRSGVEAAAKLCARLLSIFGDT